MKNRQNIIVERIKKDAIDLRLKENGIGNISELVNYLLMSYLNIEYASENTKCMFSYINVLRNKKISSRLQCNTCKVNISLDKKLSNRLITIKYYGPLLRAMYESLLFCTILELTYLKREVGYHNSCENIKKHAYKAIGSVFVMPKPDYDKLCALVKRNKTTMNAIISDAVKGVVYMNHNSDNFDEYMSSISKAKIKKYFSASRWHKEDNYNGIKLCAKITNQETIMLFLDFMISYKINSANELIKRIIYFLIDSQDREIMLNSNIDDDDSDYNETRMIRNEFRKEVLYAAAR